MHAANSDEGREFFENWKTVVSALWTLNHVNAGLRAFSPRLQQIGEALDALEDALSSIEKRSTTDILRRELSESLSRHRALADAFHASSERLRGILSRIEEREAETASGAKGQPSSNREVCE